MGRVFVSYRRRETQHIAGRLSDWLENRLGQTKVFMDVESLEPGVDFGEAIAAAVASCDVLIVLIGKAWTTMTDNAGRRRLDDPDDFIVLEVSAALQRGIRVVPVLVDGASMPHRDELPASLQGLARRHAVRIDHETFRSDVDPLLDTVERILAAAPLREQPISLLRDEPTPPPGSLSHTPDPTPTVPPPQVRSGGLTHEDVHNVAFSKPPAGKRGYNEDEVDAFLDAVEATLAEVGTMSLKATDVKNVAFAKPPIGKRGYNEDEVDEFLDLVVAEMTRRGMT